MKGTIFMISGHSDVELGTGVFPNAAPPVPDLRSRSAWRMHSAAGKAGWPRILRPGPGQCRMTGVVEIAQGITEHGPLTNPEAAHERRV